MASPAEAEGGGGRRGDGLWLPGLILSGAAILLRVAVASRREGIEVDGITYLNNARALLSDFGAFTVLHPPLYSILLTPFLWLSADAEWVARVVSAVLGGLWVWPTLWLSRGATDARVAWLAGLLVAVSPSAVEASTRVLSEPIAGLTLTTASPRRAVPRLLMAGVAALLLVAVVAAARSGGGGGEPSGPVRKPGLAAPAGGALAEPKGLPATSFDPFGDDKVENQANAANVADGDPNTVWKTRRLVWFPKDTRAPTTCLVCRQPRRTSQSPSWGIALRTEPNEGRFEPSIRSSPL